jgi:hypothetical protein
MLEIEMSFLCLVSKRLIDLIVKQFFLIFNVYKNGENKEKKYFYMMYKIYILYHFKAPTQPSISKSLYERVLSRANAAPKLKVGSRDISPTSTSVNSRSGPQNAGIDKLPEFDGLLKERKQYITLSRARTTQATETVSDKGEPIAEEEYDESEESEEEEEEEGKLLFKKMFKLNLRYVR